MEEREDGSRDSTHVWKLSVVSFQWLDISRSSHRQRFLEKSMARDESFLVRSEHGEVVDGCLWSANLHN